MKKIIKLTESDLTRIIKRVIEMVINTPFKIDFKNIYFLPNKI